MENTSENCLYWDLKGEEWFMQSGSVYYKPKQSAILK